MLFNTIEFFIFYIIVISLYYALHNHYKKQNLLLLAASYVFYGWWDHRFLFLITLSTAIDFTAAKLIETGTMSKLKKIKVSIYLVGSAVFFLLLNYDAITVEFLGGVIPYLRFEWASLFTTLGLRVFIAVIALLGLLHLVIHLSSSWNEKVRRKFYLVLSIVTNLGLLGVFKYFNFFVDSFAGIINMISGHTINTWSLKIILPVGISFYTFQTLSYTFDVYKRDLNPADSLVDFSTYVAFFPQLVAGPIERAKHLLPQFQKERDPLTKTDVNEGLWLILWGLYKKVVIADNMAKIVNTTFEPFDNLTTALSAPEDGLRLLIAIYAFALQIYCDFSGYSDIARGTARLLGFNLRLNFNLPYFATSPSSFWERWHISLSSWLRDYLYIPLGGNRKGTLKMYRNLMLTMLLGGLWHGAAWTFVLWGGYQGLILIIYRVLGIRTERGSTKPWVAFLLGLFMFQLTSLGWLLFRAQNVQTIGLFLQSIFTNPHGSAAALADFKSVLFYSWFLIIFQIIQYVKNDLMPHRNIHWFFKYNLGLFLIISIFTLASTDVKEFIYFAF